MIKPIFIYGAGGLGREIKAMLAQMPEWRLEGFYDDSNESGNQCEGIPVIGGLNDLKKVKEMIYLVLAFGDPSRKLEIAGQLKINRNLQYPVLLHPKATLLNSSTIQLGEGAVITAGAVLTTNITVGSHVLINLNVTIGHDSVIGKGSSVMPGANLAGEVAVGEGVLIGSGASVLNNITIGDFAKVGAGAVVTKTVKPKSTVVGIPAKELRRI